MILCVTFHFDFIHNNFMCTIFEALLNSWVGEDNPIDVFPIVGKGKFGEWDNNSGITCHTTITMI